MKNVLSIDIVASSSNALLSYEVKTYEDGSMFCTCPAWKFQKVTPAKRMCKHCHEVVATKATIVAQPKVGMRDRLLASWVHAIRTSSVYGVSSCSVIAECWEDKELVEMWNRENVKTKRQALKTVKDVHDMFEERQQEAWACVA